MENTQTEIEQAKAILKQHGYFVDNLWHIDDVKNSFIVADNEAYNILNGALTNECTMEQIWFSIRDIGEYKGYTEREDQ